jgi:hypothetical protein
MKTIQHIRTPLPPRGGNSFYRDKRDLSAKAQTYCGAELTGYDVNRRDVSTKKARAFYAKPNAVWAVCESCKLKAGVL